MSSRSLRPGLHLSSSLWSSRSSRTCSSGCCSPLYSSSGSIPARYIGILAASSPERSLSWCRRRISTSDRSGALQRHLRSRGTAPPQWLQLSWYIVLFGVEISYAHQNERSFEYAPDIQRISCSFKRLEPDGHAPHREELLAGNFPKRAADIRGPKDPHPLTNDILSELAAASLLTVILCLGQAEHLPACPLHQRDQHFVRSSRSITGARIRYRWPR